MRKKRTLDIMVTGMSSASVLKKRMFFWIFSRGEALMAICKSLFVQESYPGKCFETQMIPFSRMPWTKERTLYAFVVSYPQERRLSSMNELVLRWSLDGSSTGARFMLILISLSACPILFDSEWILAVSMMRISRALGRLFHLLECERRRLTIPPSWSVATKSGIRRLSLISVILFW